MSEPTQDNLLLTKLDNLYLTIDTLNEQELEKIIKYIEDQKLIVNVLDRRKAALTNEMRIERIKMRTELNKMKKQSKPTKVKEEPESDIEDIEIEIKPVKINKKKKF